MEMICPSVITSLAATVVARLQQSTKKRLAIPLYSACPVAVYQVAPQCHHGSDRLGVVPEFLCSRRLYGKQPNHANSDSGQAMTT